MFAGSIARMLSKHLIFSSKPSARCDFMVQASTESGLTNNSESRMLMASALLPATAAVFASVNRSLRMPFFALSSAATAD